MTAQKNNIYVFDTNIFLTGVDFNLINGIIYTTSRVIDEVNKNATSTNILTKIQAAIDCKKLIVNIPSIEYIQDIEKNSKVTGDLNALSETDKELLALTLELLKVSNEQVKIYTNDYSMENVCEALGIPFSSLIKKGIKKKILWEVYCPYCKEIHKPEDLFTQCERCGSKLKRRPKKQA